MKVIRIYVDGVDTGHAAFLLQLEDGRYRINDPAGRFGRALIWAIADAIGEGADTWTDECGHVFSWTT